MARAKKIFCVIAYDISNDRRRTRVVKILDKHGVRINYSVYECMLTPSGLRKVQESISRKIDTSEDTVVYYTICLDCYTKIVYQTDHLRDIKNVLLV